MLGVGAVLKFRKPENENSIVRRNNVTSDCEAESSAASTDPQLSSRISAFPHDPCPAAFSYSPLHAPCSPLLMFEALKMA